MKPAILVALLSVPLAACVNTAFLPTDPTNQYSPTESLQVFWKEPAEPHVVIGEVSAEAGSRFRERAFDALRRRAKEAGAEAIIVLPESASVAGVPASGGGTLVAGLVRLRALAIRFVKSPP